MTRVEALRASALLAPALATLIAVAWRGGHRRRSVGAFVSLAWVLPALLAVNALALQLGWWSFAPGGLCLSGVPLELLLGWGLLWGPLPALLAPRARLGAVLLSLLLLDLVSMPLLEPLVSLGPAWLVGEAWALLLVALPGLCLARWIRDARHLNARVALGVAAYVATVHGLLGALSAALEARLGLPVADPAWLLSARGALVIQGLLLLALPGISGAQEFAQRGGGTPLPYDPPLRLVTSGLYRYVRNPIQVGGSAALLAWALALQSPGLGLAWLSSLAFLLGLARWHEHVQLGARFGAAWGTYTRAVRDWRPRWRPHVGQARAQLYVKAGCGLCEGVGRWLLARDPLGLALLPAQTHARVLWRLTYVHADGAQEQGVAAFARALEHLHLGWALVGAFLRLPGVEWIAAALVDAAGGGAPSLARGGAVLALMPNRVPEHGIVAGGGSVLVPFLTLVLIAVLALGLWCFASAPGRASNRAFAAFMWLGAAWVANDLVFWGLHASEGLTWARLSFGVALALQVAFLAFAWTYFAPGRPFPRGPTALVFVVVGAAAAALVVWPPLEHAGRPGQDFSIRPNLMTFVVGGAIYVLGATGHLFVWRERAAMPQAERRESFPLVLAPRLTTAMASIAIVLPLVGIYDLLPYVGLAILAGAFIYARAMVRLRFLRPPTGLEELRVVPLSAKLGLTIAATTALSTGGALALAHGIVGPAPGWPVASVAGAVGAGLVAMGGILVAWWIVARPLEQLTRVAASVGEGRLDARSELARGPLQDELNVLSDALDAMIERLARELEGEREAAERLARAERLAVAGTLAAGVAHEVNNPLAAVSSLVQSARSKSENEVVRRRLDDALEQMDRVAKALSDLLGFARPSARQPRETSWAEAAETTLRLLRHDKRFRRLEVTTDFQGGPLFAEPERLQQILVNLLLNARDSLEERAERGEHDDAWRPELRLSSHPEDGSEVLEVRDRGTGLADELAERVFQPFVSGKLERGGTGLGLAVVADLARDLKGSVSLRNHGDGAVARVVLPAGQMGA